MIAAPPAHRSGGQGQIRAPRGKSVVFNSLTFVVFFACVLVLHNLSGKPQSLDSPSRFRHLLRHSRPGTSVENGRVNLPAYGSAILD